MKIAACYIRVSTDDQMEYSPDSQLSVIREYAKKNDYILPEEFIFRELEGISGRKADKRPEFQRMISIAKSKPKPFEAILLWKFSRFARNREDSIVYKTMLRNQLGIEVISISEPIGDDKLSVLIEAMIEAMDEYYSINLSEEVRRGMAEKNRRGEAANGAPFGYVYKDGLLVIHEERAKIVKEIFSDFLETKSYLKIARSLNTRGIHTARGKLWENRTIEYIIRNPAYIGKIRTGTSFNGGRDYYGENVKVIDGVHPAIISEETYNSAQKIVKKLKDTFPKNTHNVSKPYFLHGILKCSACGSNLTYSPKTESFQCWKYCHGMCNESHYISRALAEESIYNAILSDFTQFKFDIVNFREDTESQKVSKKIAQSITAESAKLFRIREAYENGVYTLSEFSESKSKIDRRIAELKAQLDSLSSPKVFSPQKFAEENRKFFRTAFDQTVSIEERNQALSWFISKIVFDRVNSRFSAYYFF